MPIRRIFVDWKQPGLSAATDFFAEQFVKNDRLDLSDRVVVVPGSRAGRRLRELLVEHCERRKLAFFPPDITTPWHLPELLYEPKRPFADELTQQLAWLHVLRNTPAEVLGPIVAVPPDVDDFRGWLDLARLLWNQHRELAGDNLQFQDVVDKVGSLSGSTEEQRWSALVTLQSEYLRTLDNLDLWDRQTARLFALRKRECHTLRKIILVGVVDMNKTQRRMLDAVSHMVMSLVFAPPELENHFDTYGCLLPENWRDAAIDVNDDQIVVVDDSAAQTEAVIGFLRDLGGRYRCDQITIGVPDEGLVPILQRRLDKEQVAARWGPGKSMAQFPPFQLLLALAEYLQSSTPRTFAVLVRQVDLGRWLTKQGIKGDWLTELDQYFAKHFPARMDSPWLGSEDGFRSLKQAYDAIESLLSEIRGNDRPLVDWSKPLWELVLAIYGKDDLDQSNSEDATLLRICSSIYELLQLQQTIPPVLAPSVSASQAIHIFLNQIRSQTIPSPPDANAIEMLGWLELALDDAPALVVTSLNDGYVPKSVNSDLFLPNELRTRLGLDDNDRRYARDAYALSVLVRSKQEFRVVVGQHDQLGDPLTPSRLLLATMDKQLAERAIQLFEPASATDRDCEGEKFPDHSTFEIPRPQYLTEPIHWLRITDFRAYLACPYRFYLKRVLGLDRLDDSVVELNAATFGELMHDVAQAFGSSPVKDSTSFEEIRDYLRFALETIALTRFGRAPLPAVQVQLEQLRWRFDAFAEKQALRAEEGWQIMHVEVPGPGQSGELIVDDQPIKLRGRIDRIDYHPVDRRWAVLDYKSSESGKAPHETHQKNGQWVDLQLPLYRHLAKTLNIEEPLELGYIVLPGATKSTGFRMANWSPQMLSAADAIAQDVVRRIRRQEFWPPNDPPPPFSEALAAICQDGVFTKSRQYEKKTVSLLV